MAHPSETPYVQPSSGIADGIARKVMFFGILAIFLLINVIVLYALHFTSAGVPASASNVKVSSDAFKVGSIDKKVVSFGDDGSIVVGAGTTGYLDAVAMPNDAINYITLAPIGANASSTAILAYYLKNKTTTVITTLTINDDKTTTVSTKQSTAANVQVRGIATLSNSQAVFLQSTAMGKTSLVPGSIASGAVTYHDTKAVEIASGSVSNTLAALSPTTFAATTYQPYSENSTYFQEIQAGSISADGVITMAKPLAIGTGNSALQSVTNSGPEPIAALPNSFIVTWFASSKDPNATTAKSGLCVLFANINGTEVSKIKETCNTQYQPEYFVDSTTISDSVVALSFYDANNNNALTLVMVEINAFTKKIFFRGAYVLAGVGGAFDFGSYFGFYPTPFIQALSPTKLSVLFLNPTNRGRPTTQIFQITDALTLTPISPLLRLSNGDFTLAGALPKATSGVVALAALPLGGNSYLAAYSGDLASINHKRISIVEYKGKPIGVGSGSDNLVMSGVVDVGSNYVAGKAYYATTKGDILAATSTDADADYFFVGNTTIVSKDARVGVAVSSSKLYLSSSI
ncbi:hypothetical protein SPRG_16924 [Saprolegnia parasitica CBS 223.65]|uniref:Uncharacterized protein n=1 Tax=Saprolegnia parasitica (strain CBS 223.65) TaxID=695850 RepID=A0A067BH27_SAPPC|nr:hypothetical protein SPRG_16924 [Saprolegnia parasitica CBS 223.65]KDO17669.1 hypothetical protein SPRG_16924 [Saprolegnia parasitica CBS 223.65]|eukprot:XP_012211622.1 hypothetical protein SPRG_16924 [Saprolegnia parasitica CBS 223.65]